MEDADRLSGERYGLSLEATRREFGQSMLSAAIRGTLRIIGRQSKVRRSAEEIAEAAEVVGISERERAKLVAHNL